MHRHAKFRRDQSAHYGIWRFLDFSKWRPSAIFDLLCGVWTTHEGHLVIFIGVFLCAWNRDWIRDWNRHATNTVNSVYLFHYAEKIGKTESDFSGSGWSSWIFRLCGARASRDNYRQIHMQRICTVLYYVMSNPASVCPFVRHKMVFTVLSKRLRRIIMQSSRR